MQSSKIIFRKTSISMMEMINSLKKDFAKEKEEVQAR